MESFRNFVTLTFFRTDLNDRAFVPKDVNLFSVHAKREPCHFICSYRKETKKQRTKFIKVKS